VSAKNAEKLERQLAWARGLTINDVKLTKDGDDVDTLGPMQWSALKLKVKEAFTNHINAKGFKEAMKAPLRQKHSSAKPDCIRHEGTFYRCVNVILSKRNEFIELRKSHDKDDADSRNPKPHAWESMHHFYCSDDDELLILSSSAAQALLGFSVPSDVCHEYDELDLEQFKVVVNYMVKMYRDCRNKKTVSGEHDHFGAYVGGRGYLLYFNECLKETGDTAMMNCAYAELGENVLCTSSDPPKRRIW
jgi:hypothetical protein